jgi:GMP reductase
MKLKNTKSLNFNDVNLISDRISVVSSRDEISFSPNRIIAAPMSAIQSKLFNLAAISAGISLPIHRFCSVQEQHDLLKEAIEHKKLLKSDSKLWLSVGLQDYKQRIDPVYVLMQENQIGVLFDVANGFATNLGSALNDYNNKYDLPNLMTGNVHTYNAYDWLETKGSQLIRVGIANGAACATKDKTGIARGQFTCITDIADAAHSAALISDGGIRSPADVAKAFGAGADYVMIGSYFSKAKESESQKTGYFYGGASSMQKAKAGAATNRYVEGKALNIEQSDLSLQEIVTDIADGVKSAISYSGYKTLEEFIGNGIFELVK